MSPFYPKNHAKIKPVARGYGNVDCSTFYPPPR
jgi:hypothetical protein